ncbi:MAG: hypothetical protein H6Q13_1139 [Bacteroidetes bacterium]|nr:hypothetical protein [uncultured Bacteroides sp.]MBP1613691.1 hypothetical protein [Bacteroidota bacterium]
MAVKTRIKTFLDRNAESIIEGFTGTFDSHDFIRELIKTDERGYVEELYSCIDSHNGIFRDFHNQIGQYLSNESKKGNLYIESTGRVKSDNIKDYQSENEGWRKK